VSSVKEMASRVVSKTGGGCVLQKLIQTDASEAKERNGMLDTVVPEIGLTPGTLASRFIRKSFLAFWHRLACFHRVWSWQDTSAWGLCSIGIIGTRFIAVQHAFNLGLKSSSVKLMMAHTNNGIPTLSCC
jgi:hypothetical protein